MKILWWLQYVDDVDVRLYLANSFGFFYVFVGYLVTNRKHLVHLLREFSEGDLMTSFLTILKSHYY
jgi:hypothetical protein